MLYPSLKKNKKQWWVVNIWVDVSGTSIKCDTSDRSHGWEDLWFVTGFDCITSP